MSNIKMSKFFKLPIPDDSLLSINYEVSIKDAHDGVAPFHAAVYAINNHDRLVEESAQLKSQLHDLFEHVSGVSVSEYKPEQMPYLADYIIGQAEADNSCIEKLKADKAELVRELKGIYVMLHDNYDDYDFDGSTIDIALVELIQKHKGNNQ